MITIEGQGQPNILPAPDPAKFCRPAFIGPRGNRGERLYPEPEGNRTFAELPALELKDPLNPGLVDARQDGHRPISERRSFLKNRPDRLNKGGLQTRRVARLAIECPTRDIQPLTKL